MGDVEKIARQVLSEIDWEPVTNEGWPQPLPRGGGTKDEPVRPYENHRPERADREGDTQPMPVFHSDASDIQSLVIADIERRREVGIARYGTPLQADNGRNALVDAYEEALDLACYLKQRIVEEETGRERVIWHECYTGLLERLIEDMSPIHHQHLLNLVTEATNRKVAEG